MGVVRVAVVDEPLLEGRPDYADAFTVAAGNDARSAEEWARTALEQSPAWLRRLILLVHTRLLRFRFDQLSGPDRVLGWRVVVSEPDVVMLQAGGPLMRGVIVGRRVDSGSVRVQSFVFYERPRARLVWLLAGPLHRRVAPLLLSRAGGR